MPSEGTLGLKKGTTKMGTFLFSPSWTMEKIETSPFFRPVCKWDEGDA